MKKLSFLRLLVITSLGFALSFSSNIQGPLQQYKTRELAPDMPNTALGALGFVGLMVAMVVQPVVGSFLTGQNPPGTPVTLLHWRRHPHCDLAAADGVGAGVVGAADGDDLYPVFIECAAGPWQALIPDQVPESQRGTAASYKAVLDIVAFMVGGGLGGFLMGKTASWGQIAVYATALSPVVLFAILSSSLPSGRGKTPTPRTRCQRPPSLRPSRVPFTSISRRGPSLATGSPTASSSGALTSP